MKPLLLTATLLLSAFAGAQTQEACFTPTQSQSGPVAVTMWCQILDYADPGPLAISHATDFIPLQRGFSSQTMHIQYDDWYSQMTSLVQVEFLTRFADIVVSPVYIPYDGLTWTADVPLVLSVSVGDKIRISHQSQVPHGCQLLDNCGLHMTISFY